jgi:hypothetical protein
MSRMRSIRDVAKMAAIGVGVGAVGATAGSLYAGNDGKSSLQLGMAAGMGAGLGVLAGFAGPKFAGAGRALMAGAGTGLRKKSFGRFADGVSRAYGKTAMGSDTAMMMGGTIGALGGMAYATLNSNKPVQRKK